MDIHKTNVHSSSLKLKNNRIEFSYVFPSKLYMNAFTKSEAVTPPPFEFFKSAFTILTYHTHKQIYIEAFVSGLD